MDTQAALQNSSNRYFEYRTFATYHKCIEDITKHLLMRKDAGRTLIVMDEINRFYSVLKKQWSKEISHVKSSRSGTADFDSVREFEKQIKAMQTLLFAKSGDSHQDEADVVVVPPRDINTQLTFHTVYLCPGAPSQLITNFADTLPQGSVVVKYEVES